MAIEDDVMKDVQAHSVGTENALGTFRMIYKNTSNELSDRVIDLIRFNITEKRKNFYAYDHLKNAFKEFSIKGIQRLWAGDEEIADPQSYFMDLYSHSSDAKDFSAFEIELDIVKALWWFTCGDGVYKTLEMKELKDFANKLIPDFDKKMGKDYLKNLQMSENEVSALVQKCEQWEQKDAQLYMDFVAKIYELKIKRYAELLKGFCVFGLE